MDAMGDSIFGWTLLQRHSTGMIVFRDIASVSASVLCSSSTFAMILADTFRGIIFCKEPMGEAEAEASEKRGGVDLEIQRSKQKNSRKTLPKIEKYPPEKKRTYPVTVWSFWVDDFPNLPFW